MEYIKKLGNNDYDKFKKIFTVFEKEPFYEAWTEQNYNDEFNDFIENGEIYGIFIKNEICGLVTIKAKYKKWEELDLDIEKSIYLSDIAVSKDKRNNGKYSNI